MFERARLKLTAWYLLIIMVISLSFSGFIYWSVSVEFQRRLDSIERRLDLRGLGMRPPTGQELILIHELEEARLRILFVLLYTNGVILVFSAGAGYFLAGKTLRPIENAMDEQKRFVADASHELKTPLTAMQTSVEVALRDKKINLKEVKKVLKDSLNDINDLKDLTNGLLMLARLQQNEKSMKMEKVSLMEMAKNAVKKVRPLAKKKHIKLSQKTASIFVKGDKDSIEKLMVILLENAIKYTPRKGMVILKVFKETRNAVISVKDTGVGRPREDLPRIFERFYRADHSRSKGGSDGFGLGLSIAKKIAEMHHGKIGVKSELGKGSTFRVLLPLK
jgi:two-component system sensor histidine kinase CiaH